MDILSVIGDLEMGLAAQVPVMRHSEEVHGQKTDELRPVPIHCLYPNYRWKLKEVAHLLGLIKDKPQRTPISDGPMRLPSN